ncbi:hypothetical protein GCM10017691_38540 [Pseudonocardia petroleophila]
MHPGPLSPAAPQNREAGEQAGRVTFVRRVDEAPLGQLATSAGRGSVCDMVAILT